MSSTFQYRSFWTKNNDVIGFFDRLQAMRDNYNGFTLKKLMKRVRNGSFGKTIECTSRLIEDKNLRIAEKNPCYDETLTFSAREANSFFSHESIEPQGKSIDKITLCMGKRFLESMVARRICHTTGHIFPNRPVKHRRLLRKISDIRKITIELHSGKILTIDQNTSTFWAQNTDKHLYESTLSGSAFSDKGNFLPT